jgi:hypothetical protein
MREVQSNLNDSIVEKVKSGLVGKVLNDYESQRRLEKKFGGEWIDM